MNENNISAQLRDIKPLLEIPDSSYYIYWGLILFVSLLALSIVFFGLKKLWDNRKINLEKGYLDRVEVLTFVDNGVSLKWMEAAGAKVQNLLTKGSLNHLTHQLKKTPQQHFDAIKKVIEIWLIFVILYHPTN